MEKSRVNKNESGRDTQTCTMEKRKNMERNVQTFEYNGWRSLKVNLEEVYQVKRLMEGLVCDWSVIQVTLEKRDNKRVIRRIYDSWQETRKDLSGYTTCESGGVQSWEGRRRRRGEHLCETRQHMTVGAKTVTYIKGENLWRQTVLKRRISMGQ